MFAAASASLEELAQYGSIYDSNEGFVRWNNPLEMPLSSPFFFPERELSPCDTVLRPSLPSAMARETSPSIPLLFAKRIEVFSGGPQMSFLCVVCQAFSAIEFKVDGSVVAKCGHYFSCNECQSRLIRLLLRCSSCCLDLAGEFPVCGDSCEEISKRLSRSLRTSSCPRCHSKLSKETCGRSCARMTTPLYKTAEKRLRKRVGTLVLDPSFCEMANYEGERPCSHFTKCPEHGCVTRGRGNQPRCPQCQNKPQKPTDGVLFRFRLDPTHTQPTINPHLS